LFGPKRVRPAIPENGKSQVLPRGPAITMPPLLVGHRHTHRLKVMATAQT
jgi:hypothetical protein